MCLIIRVQKIIVKLIFIVMVFFLAVNTFIKKETFALSVSQL